MNLWHSILVSAFLLVCAVGLMVSHRRSWQRFRRQGAEQDEFDYRRRQFRRRMQTSAMLGVLALALPVADWLTSRSDSPLLHLACWGVVLLLLGWLGLLALVDLLSTRFHFSRLRQSYLVEEAKLKAELRQIQAAKDDTETDARGSVARDDTSGNNYSG